MPEPVTIVRDVRRLNADDLGVGYAARAETSPGSSAPDAPALQPDDPRLANVRRLLERYGGVLLSGPSGTGKSMLAGQIADQITQTEKSRQAYIQFHASYQFEDFMEGYRPRTDGTGFEQRDGVFLRMVKAAQHDGRPHVLVIDELSRADVGRVFGEALTYIERSKRGQHFLLPSGAHLYIPTNLYVIATMNPLDRGVDEVDAAFERRFAKIDMQPDRAALEDILRVNGLDTDLVRRLLAWFSRVNSSATHNPASAVGHAYFADAVDAESLRDVWDYQLQYLVARAFQYDPDGRADVTKGWFSIFDHAPEDEVIQSADGDGSTV